MGLWQTRVIKSIESVESAEVGQRDGHHSSAHGSLHAVSLVEADRTVHNV